MSLNCSCSMHHSVWPIFHLPPPRKANSNASKRVYTTAGDTAATGVGLTRLGAHKRQQRKPRTEQDPSTMAHATSPLSTGLCFRRSQRTRTTCRRCCRFHACHVHCQAASFFPSHPQLNGPAGRSSLQTPCMCTTLQVHHAASQWPSSAEPYAAAAMRLDTESALSCRKAALLHVTTTHSSL
jgi:hypothetical protein